MSKKTSLIKSPPQKTTTKAPGPTTDIGGGVVFRSPVERLTPEDIKKLPKPIPECPLRWIHGSQLMACTNLSKGELMGLIGEGKIKAFYESDSWLCYPNFSYARLEDHQFLLVDVFELENQGHFNLVDDPYFRRCRELYQAGEGGSDNKQPNRNKKKLILTCKSGTTWKDITMTLIANDTLRIKTPQGEGRFTYHELGMSDKRTGDKPTMLWALLKLFAEKKGFISSQNVEYDPKLPDTAKRLNKHLQGLFGIQDSIYQAHYRKEKGYRTKIKFSDARQSTIISKSADEDESLQNVKDIFREADV